MILVMVQMSLHVAEHRHLESALVADTLEAETCECHVCTLFLNDYTSMHNYV